VAGAQSFSGVDQAGPTEQSLQAATTRLFLRWLLTNSAYDYVVDSIAWNTNAALTPGLQQDGRYGIVSDHLNNFLGSRQRLARLRNATMQGSVAGGSAAVGHGRVPAAHGFVGLSKTASADVIKAGDTITSRSRRRLRLRQRHDW